MIRNIDNSHESLESKAITDRFPEIREFIHDPKLKIHFTRYNNLHSILKMGITSDDFNFRIKKEPNPQVLSSKQSTGITYTPSDAVSIIDREYSSQHSEKDPDLWLKYFGRQDNHEHFVGILLNNELKTLSYTFLDEERLVGLRISPKQFDGLVVFSDFIERKDDRFFMTYKDRLLNFGNPDPEKNVLYGYALNKFFNVDVQELISKDDKYRDVKKEVYRLEEAITSINNKICQIRDNIVEEIDFITEHYKQLNQYKSDMNQLLENVSIEYIYNMTGLRSEEISDFELLKYLADYFGLPLYRVNSKFTQ